jgi:arabinogalactan oligomer/maltooligosaccharide transport system permease protein
MNKMATIFGQRVKSANAARSAMTPAALMRRRVRIGLAVVFVLIGIYQMLSDGADFIPALLMFWLGFCMIKPVHGLLGGYCLLTLYPISRSVTISLRPSGNLLQTSLWIIPPDASLSNYIKLFTKVDFVLWLWNSIIISLCVSLIGLMVSATSAYAFSRFRFPGRAPGLLFLLVTQMLPAGMLLIPIFIIVARLNLKDNVFGLVLAYTATAVPFSIWILKGYYDTIPIDLEEAALVDGASRMEAFVRMILPISTPALMTVFLFNFQSAWSEWQVANIILQSPKVFTWPIGVNNLIGQFATDWGTYSAASLVVSIPVMVLFLYSSRYVISGLTLGSVKG